MSTRARMSDGRFAGSQTPTKRRARGPKTPPRVEMRLKQKMARDGFGALYHIDRKLSLALKQMRDDLMAELGENAGPSADALCWSIAEVKMRRDTIASLVLQFGERVVNKKARQLYPIVSQLNEVERLLADLLKQFEELRVQTDLERRLEALEEGGANALRRN